MIKEFLVKSIKVLVILLGVFFLAAFLLPKFIDLNSYSQSIVDQISKKTGKKFAIKGKILLSISSQIQVTVPNISIYSGDNLNTQSFIDAKNLVLTMPLYKLFSKNRIFDSAELQEANLNLDNISSNISDLLLMEENFNLKSFTIKNSVFYNQSQLDKQQYREVNLKAYFKKDGTTKINGNFAMDKGIINVIANLEEHKKGSPQILSVNINGDNLNLDFQGNLECLENSELNIAGKIKTKIKDPSLIMNNLVEIMPFISDMTKTSLQAPIEFSSDIIYTKSYFEAKNLLVTSDHTNGSGDFALSLSQNPSLRLNFNFDSIDSNQLLSFSKNETTEASSSEIFVDNSTKIMNDSSYLNFSFINKLDVSIQLTAKKALIQSVTLENLNFNYVVNGGVVADGNLNFEINNDSLNSKFRVSNFKFDKIANTNILLGQFTNEGNNINKTLELFNLKDYINIQEDNLNYSINSKIILAPQEISIFEMNGSIGDNGTLAGSIATKRQAINDYKVDIKFNNLKLVNFELPLFKSRLESLLVNSDDDGYLSKFIWFRTLTATYDIKFAFENTELKNEKIDNLTVSCDLSPANMSLKGGIKSDFADGNFAVDLTAFSIKPSLAVKIEGEKLDYSVLTALLFDFLKKKHSEDVKVSTDAINSQIWSDKALDVFSIYKYVANFDIAIKSLGISNVNYNNFNLSARTSSDALYIDNLEFGIYGGTFQTRGNISFFEKLLYQFSFSVANLETKTMFADILPKLNVFEGPISMAGSVVTEGQSMKELISNLNMSSNFVGSMVSVDGIDSDEVVDIALQREQLEQDKVLDSLDKALSNGTTDMISLNGSFKVNSGIAETNNTTFKTRFSSSITAIYLDLNTLNISSNTQFLFLPYEDPNPISYNILLSGNLNGELQRKIDNNTLLKYVKSEYGIVTPEDILEARKMNKQIEKKRNFLADDADDNNYLYYKLQEQDLAEKEEAEEAELLKKLNSSK